MENISTNTLDEALDFLVNKYNIYHKKVQQFCTLQLKGETLSALNIAIAEGYDIED